MSLNDVLNIAASGMAAQTRRIETTADNLANANSTSSTEAGAYRAKRVIFQSVLDAEQIKNNPDKPVGVKVAAVVQSNEPVVKKYMPDNPKADKDGYVYQSNVNSVNEMVENMEASQEYRNNVEIMNTTKSLILQTLRSMESS